MNTQTMAWVAGTLLILFLCGLTYAIFRKSRHPDPHDGMARGCLSFVALPVLALLVVLIVAVNLSYDAWVRYIFWGCVIPAGWLLVSIVANKGLKAQDETMIEAAQVQ